MHALSSPQYLLMTELTKGFRHNKKVYSKSPYHQILKFYRALCGNVGGLPTFELQK